MSEHVLTELTFRALADVTRLRIMRLVAEMELAVGEIAQVLGQSQPRVSRHVAILCDANLVARRREGSWIFVRAGDPSQIFGTKMARILASAENDDPEFGALCRGDKRKLALVRAARESQAQDYFAAHAADWDQLRSLHSADIHVEDALAQALNGRPLGRVLDIGTGTGRMAELFAERADHVLALDKSPAMLRLARAKLQHLGADRVEMVQGDFGNLPIPDASVDTVLFHQVLHFAQNPAEVLREAGRVIRAGGRVAIVDFAAHSREELRERHAHARLGFEDNQVASIMSQAGFAPDPPIALDGGELVVKIWIGTNLKSAQKAA